MFCNKPASRRRARALLRQGKLLQPEEGGQLSSLALDSEMVWPPRFEHEKLNVYLLELVSEQSWRRPGSLGSSDPEQ
jgi:hypothetical protein